MIQIKWMTIFSVAVALFTSAPAQAASTNTNTLAIFLVADDVPREEIEKGTAQVKGLALESIPLLSDADFLSYNLTNHTVTISAATARRAAIAARIIRKARGTKDEYVPNGDFWDTPFVLVAQGQPIYVGVIQSMISSFIAPLPTFSASHLQMAADSTNKIELVISSGSITTEELAKKGDVRSDKRIVEALKKLGLAK